MLPEDYGDAPNLPLMYKAIVDLQRDNAKLFEEFGALLAQQAPVLPDAPEPYLEPEVTGQDV
jgi:hypothetical protein